VQEEIRQNTRDGTSSKSDDGKNCALDGKKKKWKGNKFQSKRRFQSGGQEELLVDD